MTSCRLNLMPITDAQLRKKYVKQTWLSESARRDNGRLLARCSSGTPLFYFRYSYVGREPIVRIGPYRRDGDGIVSYTLAQASEKADALRRLRSEYPDLKQHLATQHAVAAERQAAELVELKAARTAHERAAAVASARLTVRQLFDRWQKAALAARKDGGAEALRSFSKDVFPKIGQIAASDVSRTMIADLLDSVVTERGVPQIARHLLSDLRQMFTFAVRRELIAADPTYLLQKSEFGEKVERDRTLSTAELSSLAMKLISSGLGDEVQRFIWLTLALGTRCEELTQVKIASINLSERTLMLYQTKSGTDFQVSLSDFAIAQLNPLIARARAMGSEFLFPATFTKGPINKKTYTKLIADRQRPGQAPLTGRTPLVDALVLTGGRWTPHDLRRTCATWMVQHCNVSEVVANYCLNHTPSDHMARVYIRAEYGLRMKAAWQSLGDELRKFSEAVKLPIQSIAKDARAVV